jgi:hypothetical protein
VHGPVVPACLVGALSCNHAAVHLPTRYRTDCFSGRHRELITRIAQGDPVCLGSWPKRAEGVSSQLATFFL